MKSKMQGVTRHLGWLNSKVLHAEWTYLFGDFWGGIESIIGVAPFEKQRGILDENAGDGSGAGEETLSMKSVQDIDPVFIDRWGYGTEDFVKIIQGVIIAEENVTNKIIIGGWAELFMQELCYQAIRVNGRVRFRRVEHNDGRIIEIQGRVLEIIKYIPKGEAFHHYGCSFKPAVRKRIRNTITFIHIPCHSELNGVEKLMRTSDACPIIRYSVIIISSANTNSSGSMA